MLIERVELPEPKRGDILAVPVTGAYTLAMCSTYNAVPRPAAVLVADGEARVIRRRETVDDLARTYCEPARALRPIRASASREQHVRDERLRDDVEAVLRAPLARPGTSRRARAFSSPSKTSSRCFR